MHDTSETLQSLIQALLEDLKRNTADIQRRKADIEAIRQQRIASGRRREIAFAAWQEDMERLWAELRAVQSAG